MLWIQGIAGRSKLISLRDSRRGTSRPRGGVRIDVILCAVAPLCRPPGHRGNGYRDGLKHSFSKGGARELRVRCGSQGPHGPSELPCRYVLDSLDTAVSPPKSAAEIATTEAKKSLAARITEQGGAVQLVRGFNTYEKLLSQSRGLTMKSHLLF